MGGAPIGIEMAQAFLRLGSEVHIFHTHSRLIPKDEPEASEVLAKCLTEEGAKLHLNSSVLAAKQTYMGVTLTTNEGEFTGDALLVATGRKPNVDTMDLEKAGVHFTPKGIPVDDDLQTNVKHIYAAGDVLGGPQFTHYAGYQAFIAVRNALFPGSGKGLRVIIAFPTTTIS